MKKLVFAVVSVAFLMSSCLKDGKSTITFSAVPVLYEMDETLLAPVLATVGYSQMFMDNASLEAATTAKGKLFFASFTLDNGSYTVSNLVIDDDKSLTDCRALPGSLSSGEYDENMLGERTGYYGPIITSNANYAVFSTYIKGLKGQTYQYNVPYQFSNDNDSIYINIYAKKSNTVTGDEQTDIEQFFAVNIKPIIDECESKELSRVPVLVRAKVGSENGKDIFKTLISGYL